jgi:ribosomal subunit interface protein
MQSIQITIRDIPHTQALEAHIQQKAEKLSRYYQRIISCKVVIEQAQKHKHQGKLFNVRIDLVVPGAFLAANRKKNEDIYIAIRDAFHAITRQLENYACRQRGDIKHHKEINKGVVVRTFPEDGYGFIKGNDGSEYYFSMFNVCYPDFDHLQVGDVVEFLSIFADDGLQANRVTKERHIHLVEG